MKCKTLECDIDDEKIEDVKEKLLKNLDKICEEINEEFEKRQESINHYLSVIVAWCFGMDITDIQKYEMLYGTCPYDFSGELRLDGYFTEDTTVEDFLENYTGNWVPTFESHYGKNWRKYNDELAEEGFELAEYIMHNVLQKKISEIADLNEDELEELMDLIHDDFFDNSVVSDYFLDVPLSSDLKEMFYNDFIKIGEKEKEILKKENFNNLNYEMFYDRFYKNEKYI